MSDVIFEIKASNFCPADNHFTMHIKVIKNNEVIFFSTIPGLAFSNATDGLPPSPEVIEAAVLAILRLYFSDEQGNKIAWKTKSQSPTGVRLVLKEAVLTF